MFTDEELLNYAKEASKRAYCRYSKFPVGACALYEDGKIYTGCNVENSSYGLSLCAERNAMSSAIADGNKSRLLKIAIYSPNRTECYPCGACRQWISEFSKDCNASIILEDENHNPKTFFINEMLPYSFDLN